MPGWLIGLTPESVTLKRSYFSRSAALGRLRPTTRICEVSIGSTVSLRCEISWSESRITGVWYCSALLVVHDEDARALVDGARLRLAHAKGVRTVVRMPPAGRERPSTVSESRGG